MEVVVAILLYLLVNESDLIAQPVSVMCFDVAMATQQLIFPCNNFFIKGFTVSLKP